VFCSSSGKKSRVFKKVFVSNSDRKGNRGRCNETKLGARLLVVLCSPSQIPKSRNDCAAVGLPPRKRLLGFAESGVEGIASRVSREVVEVCSRVVRILVVR
jgi:hypothetical protein